jgi:hypothetical protein
MIEAGRLQPTRMLMQYGKPVMAPAAKAQGMVTEIDAHHEVHPTQATACTP